MAFTPEFWASIKKKMSGRKASGVQWPMLLDNYKKCLAEVIEDLTYVPAAEQRTHAHTSLLWGLVDLVETVGRIDGQGQAESVLMERVHLQAKAVQRMPGAEKGIR